MRKVRQISDIIIIDYVADYFEGEVLTKRQSQIWSARTVLGWEWNRISKALGIHPNTCRSTMTQIGAHIIDDGVRGELLGNHAVA